MKKPLILSTSALLITSLLQGVSAQTGKSSRPNVVYILADDLGYADLSCYGQKKFQTPNIDQLAVQGMRFTQFYAGTTVSAPSRSSLLSGLHTGHTAVRGNKEVQPEGQHPICADANTVFKLFKEAGYTTGAFGKWGLGYPGSEGDPTNQHVDSFFGYNCQRLAHNYYPDHLWNNNKRIDLPENDNGAFGIYSQDLIQEKCLEFIDKNQNNPFFLFVPCVLPHAELLVPEDSIIQKYRGIYPETPYKGVDSGNGFRTGGYCSQEHPRATFAAMVSRFDLYVGQIIQKLKEAGVYDNTLIIVTSDNGPHKEGGADPDFFNSNGAFRGYKRDLYEGGIRVPMIAVWKDKITPGTSNDHISAFWDMVPTFAEAIGHKSFPTDGISMIPTLTGKGIQTEHPHLYFEFHEAGGRQAVRQGNWKLLRQDIKNNGGTYELYNIAADLPESLNLIYDYPQKANELKAILEQSHTANSNFLFKGVD